MMDLDEGRGHRQIKRKRFFGQLEGDESDGSTAETENGAGLQIKTKRKYKVVKQAKQLQAEAIIAKLQKSKGATDYREEDKCPQCDKLKERIRQLERQNEALSNGLPGVVDKLKGLVNNLYSTPSTPSTTRTPNTPNMSSRSSYSKAPAESDAESTCTDARSATVDYELGQELTLPVHVLKKCTHSDYKKLTRDLMCALFTREQMALSSVMGKKGVGVHANKDCRPALPQDKVKAIVLYVSKKFAAAEQGHIRQVMAYKLKDIRTTQTKAQQTDVEL